VSFFSTPSFAQARSKDCSKIRKGHFYYYSSTTNARSEIFRNDTVHQEIGLTKNDTFTYRVKWVEPCKFTMQLIKSTRSFEPGEESFNKSFITTVDIAVVTKKYYTFNAVVSSELYNKQSMVSDTVWFDKR
jgi:hypothetical protein